MRVALAALIIPVVLIGRRPLLFGVLALAALRPGVARAAESRVFGRYRYAGGHKQRERFVAAVEEVVTELNVVIRGLARKKITESQTPARRIEIEKIGDQIAIRRESAPEIRGRPDGKPFVWKNRYNDQLQVRLVLSGDTLEVHFAGTSDRTVTTYKGGEAGRLEMRTVITDPRLPKPLRLAFTYKRDDGGSE